MGAPDLDFKLYDGRLLLKGWLRTVEEIADRASVAVATGNTAAKARGRLIADLVDIFLAAGCERPRTRRQVDNARDASELPPQLKDSPLLACVVLVLREIGEDTKGVSGVLRTLLGRLPS